MPYPYKPKPRKRLILPPVEVNKQSLMSPTTLALLQVLAVLVVISGFLFYSAYWKFKHDYVPEIQLAPGIVPRRQWNCTIHPDQCPDPAILHIRTA